MLNEPYLFVRYQGGYRVVDPATGEIINKVRLVLDGDCRAWWRVGNTSRLYPTWAEARRALDGQHV